MDQQDQQPKGTTQRWLTILVVLAVGIAIGFWFRGDFNFEGTWFLLVLLLACPLMMIFMMRGSKGDSRKDDDKP
jgi:multisubunit Na+/H+ antiporter MnhG subunit